MCCGEQQDESKKSKKQKSAQQSKRKGHLQADYNRLPSSVDIGDQTLLYNVKQFKRQLENELQINNKILKQYMRELDDIKSFEDYHFFVSKNRLEVTLRSICCYFQKNLGIQQNLGILSMRLTEPYQLYIQSKRDFKYCSLEIVYFLQKIQQGISERGAIIDRDFQLKKQKLRQKEPDLYHKIDSIMQKLKTFNQTKQRKINVLTEEISLKDQISIFRIFYLVAKNPQSNIQDIILSEIKKLYQLISQKEQRYNDQNMRDFIRKVIDFSKKNKCFAGSQNIDRDQQKIPIIKQIISQQYQRVQKDVTSKSLPQIPKQMTVKSITPQLSQEKNQLMRMREAQIKKLEQQQTKIRLQNCYLKRQLQNVRYQLDKARQTQKSKIVEIQQLRQKLDHLISVHKKEKNEIQAAFLSLSAQSNQLKLKLQAQSNSVTKLLKSRDDQQAKLKQKLIKQQNQILSLKSQNSSLIAAQKKEVSRLNSSSVQFSQIIALHQIQLKKLYDRCESAERQNSAVKIENQRLHKQIVQLFNIKQTKDQQISILNSKIQLVTLNLKMQNQKNLQRANVLTQELNKKADNQMILNKQINSLAIKNSAYAKQLAQMTNSIQKIKSEFGLAQDNLRKIKEQQKVLRMQYEEKIRRLQESLDQYKLSEAQINRINCQVSQHKLVLEQKLQKLNQQLIDSKLFQQHLDKSKMQFAQLKQKLQIQIIQLRRQLDEEKRTTQKLSLQLNQSKNQLCRVASKMEEENSISIILKSRLQQKQMTISSLQQELQCQRQVSDKLRKQKEQINNSSQNYKPMWRASFVEQRIFFIGDLLQKYKEEKKFLKTSIEKLMDKKIEKTKKLYDYQMDRLRNFHEIVDYHSNLVIVIKTEKALLAGYYSGELTDQGPMQEEGLILSLTNRKSYLLNTAKNNPNKDKKDKKVMKAMVFDKFYYIVGNAQIRVKSGQNMVFSNFGIAAGFYDSRKDKVDALLCNGTLNQVPMQNYEIHEVFFEQTYQNVNQK